MFEKIAKKYYCIDLVFIIQVCLTFFNDDSKVSFVSTWFCMLLVLFEIYLLLKYEKQPKKRRAGAAACIGLVILLGVLLLYQ